MKALMSVLLEKDSLAMTPTAALALINAMEEVFGTVAFFFDQLIDVKETALEMVLFAPMSNADAAEWTMAPECAQMPKELLATIIYFAMVTFQLFFC